MHSCCVGLGDCGANSCSTAGISIFEHSCRTISRRIQTGDSVATPVHNLPVRVRAESTRSSENSRFEFHRVVRSISQRGQARVRGVGRIPEVSILLGRSAPKLGIDATLGICVEPLGCLSKTLSIDTKLMC